MPQPKRPTVISGLDILEKDRRKGEGKRFIGWDGEATKDADYCLLGNSEGTYLQGRELRTVQMLEFLLDVGSQYPTANHIGFVFDYDVNNILGDLSWPHLIMLKERSQIKWNGYRIKHVPDKFFSVSNGNRRIRIEDIFTFFRTAYCTNDPSNPGALDKYHIGTAEDRAAIAEGKAKRDHFVYKDIDEIREYMFKELEHMPPLMDKIRESAYAAHMYVHTWTGPAALAKYEFRKQSVRSHMGQSPRSMETATRTAYAGGWFERFKAGVYYGPVYTADINSAYTWAMQLLPSLKDAEWRYVEGDRARDYAIGGRNIGCYRIDFGGNDSRDWNNYMRACRGVPLPLFQRAANGNMSRPFHNSGWFWNFEAGQVAKSSNALFRGAWILADDGERPFSWAADVYDSRVLLQQIGDPAEKALKWALASAYGVLAQRAGWDRRSRTAPDWHQLEWAGMITSACRSLIYTAAMPVALKDGLVSIDTDGIISTQPFERLPHGVGDGLGQWKLEEYSGIVYVQNGVYWLRNMSGTWEPPKARGIPRGQIGDVESAIRSLEESGELVFRRNSFVGYGAAIHRKDRSAWRSWESREHRVGFKHAGSRIHVEKLCRACRQGMGLVHGLHDLALIPAKLVDSQPHKLPWLEDDDEDALRERIRHEIERHEYSEVFV